jgi:hypothetical protein
MKRNATTMTIVLALAASAGFAQDPVGTAFTYQGQLKQNGSPVTGSADFVFTLWDAPTGGNQVGVTVQSETGGHPVVDGLFTIELDFNPSGEWIFDGTALWMEVSVDYPAGSGQWETLSPRQRLTTTPFASFSTLATAVPWAGILDMPAGFADGTDDVGDGSFWSLTGNAGTAPGTNFLGTTDDTPLELRVNDYRALRLEFAGGYPNVIAGQSTNYADPDVVSGTIAGGRLNSVHDWQAVVGGGVGNQAGSVNSTVAGGDYNVIGNVAGWATIGGGQQNEATQEYATIPGGQQNLAGGEYSFAAGRRAKVRDPNAVGEGDTNGDEGTFVWADSAGDEFWSTGPNQFLIRANGGVGINTNEPEATLHVVSNSVGEKIVAVGTAPYGADVEVYGPVVSDFPAYGLHAEANQMNSLLTNTATYGVYGESTNVSQDYPSSSAYGGYFVAQGPGFGAGVYGEGYHTGVWGTPMSPNGTGVYGATSGPNGEAVKGLASDTGDGTAYGGHFTSHTNSGCGVYAEATGANGRGVIGEAPNTFGIGVSGLGGDKGVVATATGEYGIGLWAEVTNDSSWAILASNQGAYGGGAGQFFGDVEVYGNLTCSGDKNFKIDHPLDPENKYLYHSCVESPDRMNIYNGNAVTDENGYATVTLPAYFETLNRDFRYQLTVIGQFAQAIVAETIRDDAFVIRTDKPNVEVSWQVTGVRQDAWARTNPMRVEVEKPEPERGTYLCPEGYDMPAELGRDYEVRHGARSERGAQDASSGMEQ